MTETNAGRCLCGYIAYECTGEVGPASYCHCEDCRRHTGSAFNIGVRVAWVNFNLVGGKPGSYSSEAESGNTLTRHFCPQCGSPIFTSSAAHPDYIYVKAGTLDNSMIVQPEHQSWLASAVSWSVIPDDIPGFKKGRGSDIA